MPGVQVMISEDTQAKCNVHIELLDERGNIKEVRDVHNMVVTTGLAHIADQLKSSPAQAAMGYMAVGTGSTSPTLADTGLGTEADRNALTSRTAAGAVVTYVGTWAPGDATGVAITEAGIFNAASSGTMLNRVTFGTITKGALDTLTITWTLTLS